MAIANGKYVSLCNQPKVQFGYLMRVTPVVTFTRFAVNAIWMERGFNAGQTHRSIYPSIFNRLRAIASYHIGRKLQLFPTLLHLTLPLGCSHWNSGEIFGPQKTRIMGLSGSEDSLTIG